MANGTAKRRITDLWVTEVSLVDKPANGQSFAIVKAEDGTIPWSVEEFVKREHTGKPISEKLAAQGFAHLKITKEGADIELSPQVERAFPGLGDAIRCTHKGLVDELINKTIEVELLKTRGN